MKTDKKQNSSELDSQENIILDKSNADSTEKTLAKAKEYGGRKDGLDPTRYGDWEKNGRCIDF